MSTSVVPAVIDALVTLFAAKLPSVAVSKGPYVTVPDGDFLTVASTPDGDRVEFTQQWASEVGAYARAETVRVPCYIDSFSGDTDAASVTGRVDGAFALLALIETALRDDPGLGNSLVGIGAQYAGGNLRLAQSESGFEVGVVFFVEVTDARI